MFKIMVVEDEELTADKIEMQIDKLDHEHFGTADNSDDALQLLESTQPDLILMDVNIEGDYDGIELTDLIHSRWEIPVIFITSLHDDRTFKRISRTNPVGYIVKPFSEIQLQRSIELVLKQLENQPKPDFEISNEESSDSGEFIFVKNRKQLEKIKISDIFYLEADGRYCQIFLIDKKFLVQVPLKEMTEKLSRGNFIQTHRSFVVNIDKIKSINLEENVIVLENMHIPLSRREKDAVLGKLDRV